MDKKKTKQYYDRLSKDEAGLRVIHSDLELLRHQTSVKVAFGNLKGGSTILDIGCGEGFDLISFEESGMCPVGLDISIEMLKRCRKNAKGPINLVCADAEKMPFRDSSFSAVHSREISFFNSCDTGEIVKHLREVRRILAPGGVAMSMLPTKDYPGSRFKPYSEEEIRHLYRLSGFRGADFVYPMKSGFFKISKKLYKVMAKVMKNRSFFIIGIGKK